MILTGPQINKSVESGDIVIEPYCAELLNPNSYNYRLGEEIIELGLGGVPVDRTRLTLDGLQLLPGRAYLGVTVERIGSRQYVTLLGGRSSMGRLGVYLNFAADLGQLGAVHRWTLEIEVVQPIRLYPGMQIGQATFWHTSGVGDYYDGYYGFQSRPTPNLIHREVIL